MAELQKSLTQPLTETPSTPEYSPRSPWAEASHRQRCRTVARAAGEIAARAETLVRLCESEQRVDPVETIASELIPLCDALRWLGRRGPGILRDRTLSLRNRPLWMWGVRSRIRRMPLGQVLVLGTWNYPLLLPGVQMAQALAAGNHVLLKPAVGSEPASGELVECFHRAGVPRDVLILLESATEAATEAIDQGVDLIVLTGAASTGRKVLSRAAAKLTPCILELSGCDAVIVLRGADWDRVARAVRFGLTFNAGATCIGPRRLIVRQDDADSLVDQILEPWRGATPPCMVVHPSARERVAEVIERAIAQGAVDRLGRFDAARLRATGQMYPVVLEQVAATDEVAASDLFAPVLSVITAESVEAAVKIVNRCPYRLSGSVFGPSRESQQVAAQLRVGSVVINDLIAPSADPRLPFGGRGESGFGVTRGADGLLAMTTPVPISERRGRVAPHWWPRRAADAETLLGSLQMMHGRGFSSRLTGLRRIVAAVQTALR